MSASATLSTSPLRLLTVVALAVAAALAVILGLSWRHEMQRLDEGRRQAAGQLVQVARILMHRRVDQGRMLVKAVAESHAIQQALATRHPARLDRALSTFRADLGAYYLVITDSAGKTLTWSNPLAALALATAASPGSAKTESTAVIAGDLAVVVEEPVVAAGRRLGTVRAGILVGRLFFEQTSTDLDAPLAVYRQGRLLHHTFPADPPPPGGDPHSAAIFRTWSPSAGDPGFEIAYLPETGPAGSKLWLAAGASREPLREARRRYLVLVSALGAGGLALVMLSVGGFVIIGGRRERRLRRQRDEALHRSEGLSDRLSHLTAVVHDIKAPLGGIQLRCESLAEESDDAEVRAALDQVIDACEKLNLYLVNVLTAARAEEGPIVPQQGVVLVPGLLEEVAEHVATVAQRRGITLTTQADEDLPPLHADTLLIERALWNLASNALAATPRGGRVTLFAERDGTARLRIGVRDTGPGFGALPVEQVFSRARPAVRNASLRAGSTGLGLFIVARIAEAHGGRAVAQHRPEGGAEVAMILPLEAGGRSGGSSRHRPAHTDQPPKRW